MADNILARRPPGTRRTEHVFSLAKLGGKSGKAQAKNSPFSSVRHDATPGGGVSISQVLGDCRPRPVCCVAMPPARRVV